jgi:hypothetical protein
MNMRHATGATLELFGSQSARQQSQGAEQSGQEAGASG